MLIKTFIILIFFISLCHSNNNIIDSLTTEAIKYISKAKKAQLVNKPEAIDLFNKAIAIGEKNDLYKIIGDGYANLTVIYFGLKKYEKAFECANLSIEARKNTPYKYINRWKKYSAEPLYALNKFSSALDTLTVAEKMSIEMQDIPALVKIYDLRARIYYVLKLFSLAEISLKKAINYEEKVTPKTLIGRLYERLGDLSKEKGEYEKAINYYNLSLKNIFSKEKPNKKIELKVYVFNRIGKVYYLLNDFQSAKMYFKKAARESKYIKNSYRYYFSICNLMELAYIQKEYSNFFNYSSQIDSLNLDFSRQRETFILKGNVFYDLGDINSALNNYERALSIIEKDQNRFEVSDFRMSILSKETKVFNRIARLYKRRILDNLSGISLDDSLFKYLNSKRSRTLYENKITKEESPGLPYLKAIEKLQQYQKMTRTGVNNNRVEQDVKLNSLKYDLVSKRIENLNEKIKGHNFISLKEFQLYIEQTNSSALVYSLNTYDQYVLYIDKNSSKVVQLNLDIDSLKVNIQTLLKNAFDKTDYRETTFNTEIAHKLYLDLWEPLERNLNLPKNIIIIPDTPLLSLPFDVLLSKKDAQNNYTFFEKPSYTKNLLVNNYNISILPSANLVKSFKPVENKKIVIFANPNFSAKVDDLNTRWSFQPLVYSKLEATEIKKIDQEALILEKEKSNEQELMMRAPNAGIIHFATHAFVDTIFDLFSGLALSTGDRAVDDGLLMGFEIEQLQLNCDLVTLSACESGRGRVLSGEGVLGLPRQFFSAGARSTLMTLWKVDDKLSSYLMPQFYNNLLIKNQPKNEALGNAKRYILKNYNQPLNGIYYSNPFFWASFNLYGDIQNNITSKSETKTFIYILLIGLFIFSAIKFTKRKYFS